MTALIIIRGIPGSGKSTLAQTLLNRGEVDNHYESDMWVDYVSGWTREASKSAHAACQAAVERSLAAGESVVVSNTFSQHWEMQPYLDMAVKYGAEVEVITATGNYGSIHNVPNEVMEVMRLRWED